MQTADGRMIFPVGNDFTLTADQLRGLFESGKLHAGGVRRLFDALTSIRRQAPVRTTSVPSDIILRKSWASRR